MPTDTERIEREAALCAGRHTSDPRVVQFDWTNNDGVWPVIDEDGCLTGEAYNCFSDLRKVRIVDVQADGTITLNGNLWAMWAE